ncbi:MAG: alanine racemase [Trueperaceae bacterium]|nr:alanine racemase [Trueperaceae bacterium]
MPRATIDLSALDHNIRTLRDYLQPGTMMLAAVKADAYGHGAVPVARRLVSQGVTWLGVATPEEALELREAGIDARILIFGPVHHKLRELIDCGVALTVVDEHSLSVVERAAREAGRSANVHLKIDTGMGRLGLPWQDAVGVAQTADRSPNVTLEGVWTHFSCADEEDRDHTQHQLEAFNEGLAAIKADGIDVPLRHSANSSALIAWPESHFDLVRPGIAVYGYHSSPYIGGLEPSLRPVMTLSAPVTFVKDVTAGQTISYGASWRAPHDTRIATVRLGYADGYPRILGNRAHVGLGNERYPIRGRVCMDQMMVDIGDADVVPGDRAILFGSGGPSAETLGQLAGTVSYEILVSVGARVTRHYTESANGDPGTADTDRKAAEAAS